MMCSSATTYCLSFEIKSRKSGESSNNNAASAISPKPTTTSTKTTKTNTTTAPTTTTPLNTSTPMQQQQQKQLQQQHQHQQQQLQLQTTQKQPQTQQLANNIILLRGARNENGQIVIQNKHGIISIYNNDQQQQLQLEHQNQPQQQQKIDKTTVAATLTQLPTATTVARKSIQTTTTTLLGSSKNAAYVAKEMKATPTQSGSAGGGGSTGNTTNTILLQTPINASQLESVLLHTANLKKTSNTSTAADRQYLFKTASRSLSTDSNRLGRASEGGSLSNNSSSSTSIASKAPFVLQTLKRLEKSQSILVIRNPSASSVAALTASASASSLSTVSSSGKIAHAATSISSDRASNTGPLLSSSSASSSISGSTHSLSSGHLVNAAQTVSVSTNTQTGAVGFTRATKSQQTNGTAVVSSAATTASKLGNITVNRTSSGAASTVALATKTTLPVSAATTTTTYLRLANATTVFANNNGGNHNNTSVNGVGMNKVVVVSGSKSHNASAANGSTNISANGMRIVDTHPQQQKQTQLCLSDVQLKLESRSDGAGGIVVSPPQQQQAAPTTVVHQQQLQIQQKQQQQAQAQQQKQSVSNAPHGSDGEPIKLPDNLESLPRADSFPSQRHRWNTNEEIAAILISFDKHNEWQSKEVKTRPKSGSLLLYSRKKVRYRRDGYCWKKRKDGKTTREDHMKLKVQGTECIYGCYVHSAILPTFHRRCYWLLQNPDIVLVHYLNVPYPDDNKMAVIAPSITLWGDKKEWTKDELVSQLKPMLSTVTSDDDSDSGNDIEISTAETVESLVCQLMEKQRLSRQAALVKQLDCGCGDASCADGKTCSHPVMRRPALLKSVSEKRLSIGDGYGPGASGTPNVVVGQKLYSRWSERRLRDGSEQQHHQYSGNHHMQQQTLPQESAIKFQIIPPQHNEQQQASYQQQQHYRQLTARNNMLLQQQQQQQQQQLQHHHQQQQQQQQSNFNQNSSTISNSNHNNQLNLQRFVGNNGTNHSHNNSNSISSNNVSNCSNNNNSHVNHRLRIAKATITATSEAAAASAIIEQQECGGSPMGRVMGLHEDELIGNSNHTSATGHGTLNRSGSFGSVGGGVNGNCSQLVLTPHQHQHQHQQQQQQQQQQTVINNNGNYSFNKHHQQQQQKQTDTHSSSTSSTQQQQQQDFYNRLQQQQQKQTANDINMSSVSNSSSQSPQQQQQQPQQMHHPHAHSQMHTHQQQQQQQQSQQSQQEQKSANTTTLNISSTTFSTSSSPSSSSLSTVEPMCMSPEHQPSTPMSPTTLGLSSNSDPLQQHQQQQQQQQQQHTQSHATSSPNMVGAGALTLSSSSSQSIMNDNVGHRKHSTIGDTLAAETTRVDENLIGENASELDKFESPAENDDASEMSSGSDMKHNSNTSKNNNHNNCNDNNQVIEYNSNSNTDGCVNIGASNDDAKINNVQEQEQQQQLQQEQTNLNSHENCEAEQQQSHVIDFESLELSSNGGNAVGQQQPHHQRQSASHSTHDLNDSLSFLNETLDLSQEDIQRTLIANLPFCTANAKLTTSTATGVADRHMMNSIDFLGVNCARQSDDEILVHGASCGGNDEDADDVFAHLDAFDMLVEFPELDLDDKEALSNTVQQQQQQQQQQLQLQQHHSQQQQVCIQGSLEQLSNNQAHCSSGLVSDKMLLNICDFSPEWAYTEGGVKVLVAGPWTANATYTLLFDAQPVPTQLIQEGVLRCYCPPHEAGFATLQVSCNNYIISDTVLFEYKTTLYQEAPYDAYTNDCLYKFTILNRLALIDEKMQVKSEASATLFEQQTLLLHRNFEDQLVGYCQELMKRTWLQNGSNWSGGLKGMTLLHLTAALGYSKLACALFNWRAESPNIILETEIDALSRDIYGYTPMAWACARNHVEMTIILYKWNHNALKIKDNTQQTPLDIAHFKGHKALLSEIYRLEEERLKQSKKNTFDNISLSLNKYSLTDVHSKSQNTNEQIYDVKDNEHVFHTLDALDMQRSHDGVFLRPVAVASNQSPPNASRFSKRSSVDSGINMDIRTKPGKSFKDVTRLQSFETRDNFKLAVESSLDTLAATNTTNSLLSPSRKMDFALCEVSTGDSSPLPDKDHDDTSTINNDDVNDVTINNENDAIVGDSDAKVLTLAEHIIAAMPERIKNEADEMMVLGSPLTEPLNSDSPSLNNGFMDPLDSLPNAHYDSFDFNDHSYRYHDVSTPCSSLSPASSGPLQSPASYSILGADPSVSSPSPPPSTKQLTEFLHASSSSQYPFEADFSKLTLTDTEQRELYEAAKCIQKAYRSYKGRQKLEEQNKERTAAIVIQNYYRRYKQYAYYRQMTNAALVIQHGYRSYCRNKRFKKSQSSSMSIGIELSVGDSQSSPTSQCLSSFYDHFRNDQQQQQHQKQHDFSSQPSTPKETSPSGPLKRTYSQSTQNQAARKIQQFMRQSRIKLQRERAEKEKLVHQRRAEYLQSLQYQEQPEIVCQVERNEMPTASAANELANASSGNNNNNNNNRNLFTYHLGPNQQ